VCSTELYSLQSRLVAVIHDIVSAFAIRSHSLIQGSTNESPPPPLNGPPIRSGHDVSPTRTAEAASSRHKQRAIAAFGDAARRFFSPLAVSTTDLLTLPVAQGMAANGLRIVVKLY
jgi:hypothetical protein